MAHAVKPQLGTKPRSAGCTSIGSAGCSPAPIHSRRSAMTHIEDARQAPWKTAAVRGPTPPGLFGGLTWRGAALAGAFAVASGLAIAALRRGSRLREGRALPRFAPADKTFATASPPLLAGTPERHP